MSKDSNVSASEALLFERLGSSPESRAHSACERLIRRLRCSINVGEGVKGPGRGCSPDVSYWVLARHLAIKMSNM